jgi:arginine exporter protein ArgO
VVTTLHASGLLDLEGAQALPFGAGALAGIAGWFLLLLGIIRRFRGRFSRAALTRTVRVIGALLLLLAGWFALRFVQYLLR